MEGRNLIRIPVRSEESARHFYGNARSTARMLAWWAIHRALTPIERFLGYEYTPEQVGEDGEPLPDDPEDGSLDRFY